MSDENEGAPSEDAPVELMPTVSAADAARIAALARDLPGRVAALREAARAARERGMAAGTDGPAGLPPAGLDGRPDPGLVARTYVRSVPAAALWSALTRAQIARLDAKDAGRLQARGPDPIPEDNPVVARLAAQAGIAVADWFAAARAAG